jgi:hypothetical protein
MEEKEDEPNLFTVNVGNLPPGKTVDISITYVTELEFEEGQLKFRLPSNNDNPSYKAASSSNSAPHLKLRVEFGTACTPLLLLQCTRVVRARVACSHSSNHECTHQT